MSILIQIQIYFKLQMGFYQVAVKLLWDQHKKFWDSCILQSWFHFEGPLEQWYSTFIVCIPPDVIFLQLCTPELLVYDSSYTESIIYI
jgi:hypothetical protein